MKRFLLYLILAAGSIAANAQFITPSIIANSNATKVIVEDAETLIRDLDAEFYTFQRHNVPFTVNNTSDGAGLFTWHVLAITDLDHYEWYVYTSSNDVSPTFALPRGDYLIYGTVQGLNPVELARVFWHKRLTVLPVLFTEGEADRVITLGTGNNILDASSWTAGEQIFFKKSGAAVGRIRIDNYNSAASQAHILIDPSSEMEVNAFSGSHGLWLVNCQNLIIDAVGSTDTYGLYLNGVGDNTSHGLCINTTADIRCAGIEIYGVKIESPQTGASGFRMLGDESATYNRNDPPLEKFRFAHIWVVESGHEGMYIGVSVEGGGAFGGPRKFEDVQAWDWIVDESSRDACQMGGVINGIFHNWVINASGTLGEGDHNSYIVYNEGNENGKFFNFRCKGGISGISMQFGDTGSNPMMWNMVMEVPPVTTGSTWNYLQVGDAPNSDFWISNINIVATSGDEIVYRFDSSGGTQDIDSLTLINITAIKGTSQNFFVKDGTNSETLWNRTSGNLVYTPATASTALLDAVTHLPATIACPSINGGVAWTTRRPLVHFLGYFQTLAFQYDIDGYIVGLDGEYPSGAGSGMVLKTDDL